MQELLNEDKREVDYEKRCAGLVKLLADEEEPRNPVSIINTCVSVRNTVPDRFVEYLIYKLIFSVNIRAFFSHSDGYII